MQSDDHLAALRADRERFAALAAVDLDATVPPCPDWNLRDLLVHLGRIHRWAIDASMLAPDADFPRLGPRPGPAEPLVAWLVDGLDELIEHLATTDLDAPCWSFMGPTTRRFWLRRQTHETAIHRWDAQSATGTTDPVDGAMAVDGIDEWLEIESERWYKGGPRAGTIHLHATDGDGEWHLEFDAARLHWTHGHLKGDAAVRGSRSDLFLVVWRRLGPDQVEVLGDASLLEGFLTQTQVS